MIIIIKKENYIDDKEEENFTYLFYITSTIRVYVLTEYTEGKIIFVGMELEMVKGVIYLFSFLPYYYWIVFIIYLKMYTMTDTAHTPSTYAATEKCFHE